MKSLLFAVALMAIPPFLCAADADTQIITLKDKSVIRGQVTELTGGSYHVTSPLLGEMQIPTASVLSIQPAPPVSADIASLKSTLSSKVQNLVSTKEGMNAVAAFSGNKDLKAVMNDPQVMQAIQNGDYQTLMKSPAMKTLLDNPQTHALIQSVLGTSPQATSKASSQADVD